MRNGVTIDLLAFSMDDIKDIGRLLAYGLNPDYLTRPNQVLGILANGTDNAGKSAFIDYFAQSILPGSRFLSGFGTDTLGKPHNASGKSELYNTLAILTYEDRSFEAPAKGTSRVNIGLNFVQNDLPENIDNLGIQLVIKAPFLPQEAQASVTELKRMTKPSSKQAGYLLDKIRKTRDFNTRPALKKAFEEAGGFKPDAQWPRLVSISIRDDIAAYPAMQKVIEALKAAPTRRGQERLSSP